MFCERKKYCVRKDGELCGYNFYGQCDYKAETATLQTKCRNPEVCRTADTHEAILRKLHLNGIRQLKIERQNEEILKLLREKQK